MTRIMLQWFLLLVLEGLVLLSSGETTIAVTEGSTPGEQHLLSVASTARTEDDSTIEETSRELISLASKASNTYVGPPAGENTDEQHGLHPEIMSVPTVKGDSMISKTESQTTETETPGLDTLTSENVEQSTEMESTENGTQNSLANNNLAVASKDSSQSQHEKQKMTSLSPKSATRKRSLNATTDTSSFEETTTLLPHTDVTLPQIHHDSIDENESSSVNTDSDGKHSHDSTPVEREDSFEDLTDETVISSATTTPTPDQFIDLVRVVTSKMSENIPPELGERESKPSETATGEGYTETSVHRNTPIVIGASEQTDSSNTENTKMPLDAYSHTGYMEHESMGVTFDPDGMKHDGPQDPDSIVFSVSSDSSRAIEHESYKKNIPVTTKESESHMEREGNLNEAKVILNETGTIEVSENFHIHPVAKEVENVSATRITHSLMKNVSDVISSEKGRDDSEEMIQDAPHFGVNMLPDFIQSKPVESVTFSEMQTTEQKSTDSPTGNHSEGSSSAKSKESDSSTDVGEIGLPIHSLSHQTDQSVIRPVKVLSPSDKYVSTPILPGSFSTQSEEISTVPNLSVPKAGSKMVDKVEDGSPDTASPITILPNSAPEEIDEDTKISPMFIQPELADSFHPGAVNSSDVANTTIAGIAVKTSVSVSLPLSNSKSSSQSLQQSISEDSAKSTSISLGSEELPSATKESNDSSFIPIDGLTTTIPPMTIIEATGFKIRKPKLKIGGIGDEGVRPSRPPYSPRRPSGTTEAGPSVSIFKKMRTRIASITSSTTARPLPKFSTIRIHYATHQGMAILPGEILVSTEPVTTTTTTEAPPTTPEEPIEEEPFTDQTVMPVIEEGEKDVTLVKVAGYIALDRGIRWQEQLDNRHSPEYKKSSQLMLLHLERLFRSSPIASRLWKIEIDGFSGSRSSRPVGVDFFLYLIKSTPVAPEHLESIFHEKLSPNRTFATYRVDATKTAFEILQEEPLVKSTPPPDDDNEGAEPPIPQWAIACIVIGAASLIFIVLFAAVTLYGRHHMRRRYSSKLSEEGERSSGEWESKMAAAYENMAADTLYDAEENSYKKHPTGRIATFHGIPSPLKRCDSWSSDGRSRTTSHGRWTSHHH